MPIHSYVGREDNVFKRQCQYGFVLSSLGLRTVDEGADDNLDIVKLTALKRLTDCCPRVPESRSHRTIGIALLAPVRHNTGGWDTQAGYKQTRYLGYL